MSLKKLLLFLKKNKLLILVISLYFLICLPYLTKLPIFNDEAIYLDWGFREINFEDNLYYSLYDGKTPLLMWIFAIFGKIFSDPLFAGRLVSVIFGFLTLIGIYKIAYKIWDEKIALLSSLIYSITPIFVFFNRQALMESAVSTIGIWTFYFIQNSIKEKSGKNAIFAGITLGLGFLIKTSSVIFLLSSLIILLFSFRGNEEKGIVFKKIGLVLASFFASSFIIFINPMFWEFLPGNSRFVFTAGEILGFPIGAWLSNLYVNINISFFLLTPFIFLLAILGIYLLVSDKKQKGFILGLWFIACFFLEISLTRSTSQRYIVSFLPPLVMFSSVGLYFIKDKIKNKVFQYFLPFLLLPSLVLSFVVTLNPLEYLTFFSKITPYISYGEYVSGQPSGYGVPEAIDYIKTQSNGSKTMVGIALNTGNPESAIEVYFQKSENNISAAYVDSRIFGEDLREFKCLSAGEFEFFFVARNDEQAGLNQYFYEVASFKKPGGENSVKIYKLKPNCEGETFTMTFVK